MSQATGADTGTVRFAHHDPLAGGDPDVVLNLQAVFNRCYDEGAYVRRIDYRRDPVPPLQAEDAAWADGVLRDRQLGS